MTLIKRGTVMDRVVVAESLWRCSCGHTDVSREYEDTKSCPKCGENMELIRCSTTFKD